MISTCTEIRAGSEAYPAVLSQLLGSDAPASLYLRGDAGLLSASLLAFFCSNRVPGKLLLRTLDLARELRDLHVPTIGGFQTPLERESLGFLLRGPQPVVVSPARGIEPMRLPRAWRPALVDGRLLLISRFPGQRRRPTVTMAEARNALAAALAQRALITHASPGGRTHRLARQLAGWNKPLLTLDDPANADLIRLGAEPIDSVKSLLL
jgi:predicted Rossmann fold nucleotide-binding protein DprA/Smf involved in DNA uptake